VRSLYRYENMRIKLTNRRWQMALAALLLAGASILLFGYLTDQEKSHIEAEFKKAGFGTVEDFLKGRSKSLGGVD
jgi:hypothetical protein